MSDTEYTTPEGFTLYKPLLMPDARTFTDVFEGYGPYQYGGTHNLKPQMIGENELGPFTWVKGRNDPRWTLEANLNDEALRLVSERIVTPDDLLSFEIIVHPERDRALVIVQHGYIPGGYWIAYIDPKTIPYRPDAT